MSRIFCNLRREISKSKPGVDALLDHSAPRLSVVPCRTKYYHNRHRDQRFRLERARKMWPVDLPDFDEYRRTDDQKISPDQVRSKFKEKGIAPPRSWDEREIYVPCTMGFIEEYKPPAFDGKSSSVLDRVKTSLSEKSEDWYKSNRALSAVRNFEGDEFELKDFQSQATEIYVKAHEALVAKDESKIFDYVTEHCFPKMAQGSNRRTLMWTFIGEVEPPKVVQVRVADLLNKANKYAQITVRFHTKQIMAVFDRHGRLILGSPTDVKEVLEYVVFEKYLANEYGLWRIHERISNDHDETLISTITRVAPANQ